MKRVKKTKQSRTRFEVKSSLNDFCKLDLVCDAEPNTYLEVHQEEGYQAVQGVPLRFWPFVFVRC